MKKSLTYVKHVVTREQVLRAMVLRDFDLYEVNKEPWTDTAIAFHVADKELHCPKKGWTPEELVNLDALGWLLEDMVTNGMLVAYTREGWQALGKNPTARRGPLLYATHAHLGLWGIKVKLDR